MIPDQEGAAEALRLALIRRRVLMTLFRASLDWGRSAASEIWDRPVE
jgi:hypothetical protein